MANYFNGKIFVVRKIAIIFILSLLANSHVFSLTVKSWIEFKGGIQFIDTTITQLTDSLYVQPSIAVNHEIFPFELSYNVLSDNTLAGVVSAGYLSIGGEVNKYFTNGVLNEHYKVDFSRFAALLGGRKYFGVPGRENNTCWFFGADMGLAKTINANLTRQIYSMNGNTISDGYFAYDSIDIMFRAIFGAQYWINKNLGIGINAGYIWSQPHISGTAFAIADRDFSGIYFEASVVYDFMSFFVKTVKIREEKKDK
jgi:hypothetical protein